MAFTGFGLLYMVVNAASMIDQRRALGRAIAAQLALLPVILAIAVRLSPRPLWQAIIGHGAWLVALSLAHSALMTALRIAAFGFAGLGYAPDTPLSARLLFEARKDIITYAAILAVFLLARRLVATAPPSTSPTTGALRLIALRDGSRQLMLRPDEIDRVSAAGNYVEVHGAFGSELVRRSLADLEAELADCGFERVHRSHLVRRAAIAAIETRQSGDFLITLRSGAELPGSRRFHHRLG